jgi:acetyl-CoA acetyltransferase
VVDTDEGPRADTSLEALGRLRPAFPNDAPEEVENLVVTAGNAPGAERRRRGPRGDLAGLRPGHGLEVRARITGYASGGTEPRDSSSPPSPR